MVVIVLTAVPPGLRGHLNRWLLEIAPGVFVGFASGRVRSFIWERIVEFADTGRALMVHATRGEQRLAFKVHCHDWTPEDHDGVMLIRRPMIEREPGRSALGAALVAPPPPRATGTPTSAAVRRNRARRMKFRPRED